MTQSPGSDSAPWTTARSNSRIENERFVTAVSKSVVSYLEPSDIGYYRAGARNRFCVAWFRILTSSLCGGRSSDYSFAKQISPVTSASYGPIAGSPGIVSGPITSAGILNGPSVDVINMHQQRAVELEPRNAEAYFRLADVFIQVGNYEQALAALEKVRELTPEFEGVRAGIARVYALTGRQREAQQMIRGLKADLVSIAAVYAALGDKESAFKTLEKAAGEHNPILVGLKVSPPFDSLYSDPRMIALLRRMNLAAK